MGQVTMKAGEATIATNTKAVSKACIWNPNIQIQHLSSHRTFP
jgi:hypothetical protein